MNRRHFFRLFGVLCGSVCAFYDAFADWSMAAFNARSMHKVLMELFLDPLSIANEKILLECPKIAENGAIVPVYVDASALLNVSKISLLAEKNGYPLVAVMHIPEGTLAQISMRIRLAESTLVKVVVQADGKLYHSEQFVDVVIGGCVA